MLVRSIVGYSPEAMAEALESDARRLRGEVLSPLDGIPYTAKDSFMARGLTAAAASFAAFGLGEETWLSGRAPHPLDG
jgi:Asp-tRNA(Asn)/Glu-tRNA(Gln) amidotransferase A subunit family amidase